MTATYTLATIGPHGSEVAGLVADAFRELGLEGVAELDVRADLPNVAPAVVLVDWREGDDPAPAEALAAQASAQGVLLIPIVDHIDEMPPDLPAALGELNAVGWDHGAGLLPLVRACLRELGVHERQRKVFISHRRTDAAVLALDLHDRLRRTGWVPFVDRLGIDEGQAVQAKINECLDDMAFLILIESPAAHESRWIDHEVLYATDHGMGVLVVNLDNAPRVLTARDFPPHRIAAGDVTPDGSQLKVGDVALDGIVAAAEIAHAAALARRRRFLIGSTRASAERAGLAVEFLPGWRLRVAKDHHEAQILSHLPCLPQPEDLHAIHEILAPAETGLVIHHPHAIPEERRRLLDWMVENRNVQLVPGNAIGAYWQTA